MFIFSHASRIAVRLKVKHRLRIPPMFFGQGTTNNILFSQFYSKGTFYKAVAKHIAKDLKEKEVRHIPRQQTVKPSAPVTLQPSRVDSETETAKLSTEMVCDSRSMRKFLNFMLKIMKRGFFGEKRRCVLPSC